MMPKLFSDALVVHASPYTWRLAVAHNSSSAGTRFHTQTPNKMHLQQRLGICFRGLGMWECLARLPAHPG